MTVVVTIGNAEQGIANDIDSALVLGYGIYKGITGKLFARKVMPVNALQQEQCTIWLFLYQQLCLMDTEGKTDYQGELDEISGRGSGTWFFEKKSYNLKLNGSADLLGMGAGKKWALLANVIDESQLRNKLIYDFAREIGSYSGFAPNCEHVDVYLNGTYVETGLPSVSASC